MVKIRVRKSKGSEFMNREQISKAIAVSDKFQITIPQHVREFMDIDRGDKVFFSKAGSTIMLEKVKDEKVINSRIRFLKLVTFVRQFLKAGIPVFITGKTAIGKTFLAKETASYGFEEVMYLGEQKTITNPDNESKFMQAAEDYKNTSQLLILDEYQYLESALSIRITEELVEQYNGSLMIATASIDNLPPLEIFSEGLHIQITGNDQTEFDYEIMHFYKKVQRKNEVQTPVYHKMIIDVPNNLEEALTVSLVLQAAEGQLPADVDAFLAGQYKAGLEKLGDALINNYYVDSVIPTIEGLIKTEEINTNFVQGLRKIVRKIIEEAKGK